MASFTNNKPSSLSYLLPTFSLHLLFTEGLTQARTADQLAPTLPIKVAPLFMACGCKVQSFTTKLSKYFKALWNDWS